MCWLRYWALTTNHPSTYLNIANSNRRLLKSKLNTDHHSCYLSSLYPGQKCSIIARLKTFSKISKTVCTYKNRFPFFLFLHLESSNCGSFLFFSVLWKLPVTLAKPSSYLSVFISSPVIPSMSCGLRLNSQAQCPALDHDSGNICATWSE